MPIPLQQRSLRSSVGNDKIRLNNFNFTSVVAPSSQLEKMQASHAPDCWNEILQFPWCYIRIQFELVEVARLFLLWPGNKARLAYCKLWCSLSIDTTALKVQFSEESVSHQSRAVADTTIIMGVVCQNKIETTGIKLESPVVRCSQHLETTECNL